MVSRAESCFAITNFLCSIGFHWNPFKNQFVLICGNKSTFVCLSFTKDTFSHKGFHCPRMQSTKVGSKKRWCIRTLEREIYFKEFVETVWRLVSSKSADYVADWRPRTVIVLSPKAVCCQNSLFSSGGPSFFSYGLQLIG